MTGCTSIQPSLPATSSYIRSEKTPQAQYFQCDSINDVLDQVVAKEKANVLAFGEIHPSLKKKANDKKTTLKYFSHYIFPRLLKAGYRHVVMEGIYGDKKANKALTQALDRKSDLPGKHFYPPRSINIPGLKVFLKTASKQEAVYVYGGGLKRDNPVLTNLSGKIQDQNYSVRYQIANASTQNSLTTISSLIRKNPEDKIVYFGGTRHNELYPHCPGLSFAQDLSKTASYVEIDLLSAEMMQLTHPRCYPEYKAWQTVTPPKGKVTLIKRGRSYTIILPRGIITP